MNRGTKTLTLVGDSETRLYLLHLQVCLGPEANAASQHIWRHHWQALASRVVMEKTSGKVQSRKQMAALNYL